MTAPWGCTLDNSACISRLRFINGLTINGIDELRISVRLDQMLIHAMFETLVALKRVLFLDGLLEVTR